MAAHKLPRLSKSLLDSPQLITESKFREIAEVLENRDPSLINAAIFDSDADESVSSDQGFGENIGVLRINGPTTYKPTGWEALCMEGCSYVGLMQQMDEIVESGLKTVVMDIDSPGGQAYRAFSTARYLRKKADENGIKLVAYVDGMAASAGYALASVAHKLIANPSSECGSIGVVLSLVNSSEKDKKDGIQRKYITAGKSKVPFDESGEFKEEFLTDLQNKINKTYGQFVEHVSIMRGIDGEVVKGTEAKMFDAEDALELNLVDALMEEDDFREYLAKNYIAEASANPQSGVINTTLETKTKEENLMSDTPKTEASVLEGVTAEMFAQMQSQLAAYQAKEQAAEKASLVAKLEGVSFLSNHTEALTEFFMSADEGYQELMNAVIGSAQAENEKVVEEAASQIAEKEQALSAAQASVEEANAKVEAAQAEVLKTKEEFGKGDAIEGDVKDKTSLEDSSQGKARTAQLDAVVKAKLAANK